MIKKTAFRISLTLAALACTSAIVPAVAQDSILRVGSPNSADIATLDPHRATVTADKGIVGWMFNGLLRFPPGSSDPTLIEGDLAQEWSVSEDGKVWSFKLREGVKFHGDFGTLTSQDVVYSLQRAANKETSSFAASYGNVKEIRAVDELTVEIELVAPDRNFAGLVADYHGGQIVSKAAAEKFGDEFGTNPIGTGPFMFVEHVTQQYVRLAANPDHFRGAPKITEIMYRLIPNDSSRELAFSTGELDLISGKRDQRWVESMRQNDKAVVSVFQPGEFRTLHLNQTIAPLDNVLVRQAIAHAVNVEEIRQFVGPDIAKEGCSVIPPGYVGMDCSVGTYNFDPERSKALLAEAGLPDGFAVDVVVSNSSSQQPIMEVIQAQLAAIGVKLNMQVVDHPTYHEKIRENVSAMVFYGAARFPVADSYLTEFYHSDAIVGKPTAITNFSHCDVADSAIEAARIEQDEAKQLELWKDAQQQIFDQVCSVPLFDLQQVWVYSDRLSLGYELNGALNLAPPLTPESALMAQ